MINMNDAYNAFIKQGNISNVKIDFMRNDSFQLFARDGLLSLAALNGFIFLSVYPESFELCFYIAPINRFVSEIPSDFSGRDNEAKYELSDAREKMYEELRKGECMSEMDTLYNPYTNQKYFVIQYFGSHRYFSSIDQLISQYRQAVSDYAYSDNKIRSVIHYLSCLKRLDELHR